MRIYQRSIGILTVCTLAGLVPESAHGAAGAQALSNFIGVHVINQALAAFGGIAAAAIFYYAIRMIFDAYKDKAYTDVINSFLYVLIGFIVIGLSSAFTNSFAPSSLGTGAGFPNLGPLTLGVASIKDFIIRAAAGVFTLMVVAAGLRMIMSQGDEAVFDKWRKILTGNCLGVMIMFIADALVTGVSDTSGPGAIVEELVGISLFILTVIGTAAIISLIIAGVLLIVSIDESMRDRAKRAIIGTLLALVVVIIAYTVIVTFGF